MFKADATACPQAFCQLLRHNHQHSWCCQVNFFAVVALTQAVAPYMINQRSGLIGNNKGLEQQSVVQNSQNNST